MLGNLILTNDGIIVDRIEGIDLPFIEQRLLYKSLINIVYRYTNGDRKITHVSVFGSTYRVDELHELYKEEKDKLNRLHLPKKLV